MTAETLRRLLADRELERLAEADTRPEALSALLSVIQHLAEVEYAFEASPTERERLARLAADLLRLEMRRENGLALPSRANAAWHEKAAAAADAIERVKRFFAFPPDAHEEDAWEPLGKEGLDAAVARALMRALRETLCSDTGRRERALRHLTRAEKQEANGEIVYEFLLRSLLAHQARTARDLGASRPGAALQALAVAAVRKGEMQCPEPDHRALALMLGAAAGTVLAHLKQEKKNPPSPAALLAKMMEEPSSARAMLWEGIDLEDARRLGAAAALAAFGHGHLQPPRPAIGQISRVSFRLPEAWLERFGHVAAPDAAEALEYIAVDPRASEAERRMAEALSETLRAHPAPWRVSFAEVLGLDPGELRTAPWRPGRRLFRASLRGRRPTMIVCTGVRGRPVRCRAVADSDGAIVGYRAFDPLSREIGGRAVYALYDLDGRRCGHAWDRQANACAGAPAQGFITAPERIVISKN